MPDQNPLRLAQAMAAVVNTTRPGIYVTDPDRQRDVALLPTSVGRLKALVDGGPAAPDARADGPALRDAFREVCFAMALDVLSGDPRHAEAVEAVIDSVTHLADVLSEVP